ncbi:hypothetical protein A3K34_03600 [candidate division WWE3 bacterium RIFOXYC1_FULL_40_10]|uniref:Uncharacterized protein n=1 Tax=candidate division WWE3 bacterium RIFOXYA2_FULL_46_9 TaxID=1802636 RepID=A0A1F4VYY9_UNCKA|nr:MAG: hypothetical protein A3K58_03600 [candidate division WWE3 bacterium RIFOXYB1_FULL_40_22]OGC61929.1 MAG: hypothetical protein A3K37_03600 [candidate division WWE3 bacterium RIFOXYA1_FULL_40_11]OGC62295.1 MAG: hypothetical protein A2264_03355 [candidate division WWE3 bacterium RIFOXYA2_FULL_46_9]OGC64393.1 MAG: hypothetical protein A2326_00945 [candidate division WWE3 bacterium RIFOXYB2_FULL_41_6]OGC66312.1 MAG: hypothetical protein A3K34_03600 [candidate division WWE3 bacterium RIFOXYC1_
MNEEVVVDIKTVEEKLADLQRRKKKFNRIMAIVKLVGIFLILFVISSLIYNRYFKKSPPAPFEPKEDTPTTEPNDFTVITPKIFTDDTLKISFQYPGNAQLTPLNVSEDKKITKLSVLYDTSWTDALPQVTESAVNDGYALKITRFETQVTDIQNIAKTKLKSLQDKCFPVTEYTSPHFEKIDNIDSIAFEANKCGGDYKYIYVPRFYAYYELELIAKGDFGYTERYSRTMGEVVDSLKFFSEDPPGWTPFIVFDNAKYLFSFKHPRFDSNCCDVPGPKFEKNSPTNLGSLVDPTTKIDSKNFDGITLYADKETGRSFDQYVERQKTLFNDEYVIVKGENPKTSQEEFTVGGKRAIRIKGYSWKGNDLIYLDTLDRGAVITVSVNNLTGESFEIKLKGMLESFEFRN